MFAVVVLLEGGVFIKKKEREGAGLLEEFEIIFYSCVMSEFSRQSLC